MRSLFVTMDPNITGAAAAASTLAERGSAVERASIGCGCQNYIDGCGYFLSPPHGKPWSITDQRRVVYRTAETAIIHRATADRRMACGKR